MRRRWLRVSGPAVALAIALAVPSVFGAVRGAQALPHVAAGPDRVADVLRHAPPLTGPSEDALSDRQGATDPKRPAPALLAHVDSDMTVRAHPVTDARAIGTMPSSSKYYHAPIETWIQQVSPNGRWGLVDIPYSWPQRDGWILIAGLQRETTGVQVEVDLSQHRVTVTRFGERLFSVPATIGAPSSPTPPGRYFVTDRVPFAAGSALGSFAFGISGIQPNLPPGWSGGNQLAIHGTNDPGSIGRSVSAGCVRVSEASLHRLESLLQLGTPVVIEP
jgi:lipoprotein-anchoring transpeptidase ErfK/SrfK